MCGLVGVFGKVNKQAESLFQCLLIVDVLRGPHSTGVAVVNADRQRPATIKGVLSPYDLFCHPSYRKAVEPDVSLLLGHNRFATMGEVTADNAHPFRHGHITMAHNGTLDSYRQLPGFSQFETDSETICHAISKEGIVDTWAKLNGAAALTWWDNRKKTMNFIRNTKRPLWFAHSKDKKLLIWASESWMIRQCADRVKLHLDTNEHGISCWSPNEHQHFSATIDKDGEVLLANEKLEGFSWAHHHGHGTTVLGNNQPNQNNRGVLRLVGVETKDEDDQDYVPKHLTDKNITLAQFPSHDRRTALTGRFVRAHDN